VKTTKLWQFICNKTASILYPQNALNDRMTVSGSQHALCLFDKRENVILELEIERTNVLDPKLAEVCEHIHSLARLQ